MVDVQVALLSPGGAKPSIQNTRAVSDPQIQAICVAEDDDDDIIFRLPDKEVYHGPGHERFDNRLSRCGGQRLPAHHSQTPGIAHPRMTGGKYLVQSDKRCTAYTSRQTTTFWLIGVMSDDANERTPDALHAVYGRPWFIITFQHRLCGCREPLSGMQTIIPSSETSDRAMVQCDSLPYACELMLVSPIDTQATIAYVGVRPRRLFVTNPTYAIQAAHSQLAAERHGLELITMESWLICTNVYGSKVDAMSRKGRSSSVQPYARQHVRAELWHEISKAKRDREREYPYLLTVNRILRAAVREKEWDRRKAVKPNKKKTMTNAGKGQSGNLRDNVPQAPAAARTCGLSRVDTMRAKAMSKTAVSMEESSERLIYNEKGK
ncbi:hypothetical protein F5I97DRAFT_1827679 [Phlebopus sp. FC_14]|nr:hypothetical protein F5I97DRAFT_1827679 [Phlebopus sp. FC_14]